MTSKRSHRPKEWKTERMWAERLELLKRSGNIMTYVSQPKAFQLAHRCTYTPDFMVVNNDGSIEFHEIKAGRRLKGKIDAKGNLKKGKMWRSDNQFPASRIKFKVASQMYPQFNFYRCLWREDLKEWRIELQPVISIPYYEVAINEIP